MAETRIQLEADKYFHIFNHAVGDEKFFKNDRNYQFFLDNLKDYIPPIADLLCYCLMQNHFHLVVKFHSIEELKKEFSKNGKFKETELTSDKISELLSKQFSNYFNKYAKSFNAQEYRRGSLFKRAFMRIPINSESYLIRLIRYVHHNPVKDKLVSLPYDWKYSSYNALVSQKPTMLVRAQVIDLFEDLDNFIFYHKQQDDSFEL